MNSTSKCHPPLSSACLLCLLTTETPDMADLCGLQQMVQQLYLYPAAPCNPSQQEHHHSSTAKPATKLSNKDMAAPPSAAAALSTNLIFETACYTEYRQGATAVTWEAYTNSLSHALKEYSAPCATTSNSTVDSRIQRPVVVLVCSGEDTLQYLMKTPHSIVAIISLNALELVSGPPTISSQGKRGGTKPDPKKTGKITSLLGDRPVSVPALVIPEFQKRFPNSGIRIEHVVIEQASTAEATIQHQVIPLLRMLDDVSPAYSRYATGKVVMPLPMATWMDYPVDGHTKMLSILRDQNVDPEATSMPPIHAADVSLFAALKQVDSNYSQWTSPVQQINKLDVLRYKLVQAHRALSGKTSPIGALPVAGAPQQIQFRRDCSATDGAVVSNIIHSRLSKLFPRMRSRPDDERKSISAGDLRFGSGRSSKMEDVLLTVYDSTEPNQRHSNNDQEELQRNVQRWKQSVALECIHSDGITQSSAPTPPSLQLITACFERNTKGLLSPLKSDPLHQSKIESVRSTLSLSEQQNVLLQVQLQELVRSSFPLLQSSFDCNDYIYHEELSEEEVMSLIQELHGQHPTRAKVVHCDLTHRSVVSALTESEPTALLVAGVDVRLTDGEKRTGTVVSGSVIAPSQETARVRKWCKTYAVMGFPTLYQFKEFSEMNSNKVQNRSALLNQEHFHLLVQPHSMSASSSTTEASGQETSMPLTPLSVEEKTVYDILPLDASVIEVSEHQKLPDMDGSNNSFHSKQVLYIKDDVTASLKQNGTLSFSYQDGVVALLTRDVMVGEDVAPEVTWHVSGQCMAISLNCAGDVRMQVIQSPTATSQVACYNATTGLTTNKTEIETARCVCNQTGTVTIHYATGTTRMLYATGATATRGASGSWWYLVDADGHRAASNAATNEHRALFPPLIMSTADDRENNAAIFSRSDQVIRVLYQHDATAEEFDEEGNLQATSQAMVHTRVVLHSDGTKMVSFLTKSASNFLSSRGSPRASTPALYATLTQDAATWNALGSSAKFVVEHPIFPSVMVAANNVRIPSTLSGCHSVQIRFGDGSYLKRHIVVTGNDAFLQTLWMRPSGTNVRVNHNTALVFLEAYSAALKPTIATAKALCEGIPVFDLWLGEVRLVDHRNFVTHLRNIFSATERCLVEFKRATTQSLMAMMAPPGFSQHKLSKREMIKAQAEQRRREEEATMPPQLIERLRTAVQSYVVEHHLIGNPMETRAALMRDAPLPVVGCEVNVAPVESLKLNLSNTRTLKSDSNFDDDASKQCRDDVVPLLFVHLPSGRFVQYLSSANLSAYDHRISKLPKQYTVVRNDVSGEPGLHQISFFQIQKGTPFDSAPPTSSHSTWLPKVVLPPKRLIPHSSSSSISPTKPMRTVVRYLPPSPGVVETVVFDVVASNAALCAMQQYVTSLATVSDESRRIVQSGPTVALQKKYTKVLNAIATGQDPTMMQHDGRTSSVLLESHVDLPINVDILSFEVDPMGEALNNTNSNTTNGDELSPQRSTTPLAHVLSYQESRRSPRVPTSKSIAVEFPLLNFGRLPERFQYAMVLPITNLTGFAITVRAYTSSRISNSATTQAATPYIKVANSRLIVSPFSPSSIVVLADMRQVSPGTVFNVSVLVVAENTGKPVVVNVQGVCVPARMSHEPTPALRPTVSILGI